MVEQDAENDEPRRGDPSGDDPETTPPPLHSPRVRKRMTIRTAIALLAWTFLADWLIYRTYGYAGPAVFLAAAPLLLLMRGHDRGQTGTATNPVVWLAVCVSLWCASVRLIWVGSFGASVSAFLLLMALALSACGRFPWAIETLALPIRAVFDGVMWITQHRIPALGRRANSRRIGSGAITWILPAMVTLVFAGIFVLANPDLMDFTTKHFQWMSDWSLRWLGRLDAFEIPFCLFALVIGAGLFFPVIGAKTFGNTENEHASGMKSEAYFYLAFRNMLLCLIALYLVYLAFEFQTLFRREFPDGFYYAGYAHEGAAWLTAALALATGLLSIIFQGNMLNDPRIGRLRLIAWVWAAANLMLSVAVYNRLTIYVQFNGLTYLRIVGYFGITVVVIGFLFVVAKIAWGKSAWWLIRTQLTALAACLIALAIFPSDWAAHRFNVAQINAGYLPPAVMIAVKSVDDSGYLPLLALTDCEDPIIREGVRGLLAEKQMEIERIDASRPWHWTRFQLATDRLYEGLAEQESKWHRYLRDTPARNRQIDRFEDYAMQWY